MQISKTKTKKWNFCSCILSFVHIFHDGLWKPGSHLSVDQLTAVISVHWWTLRKNCIQTLSSRRSPGPLLHQCLLSGRPLCRRLLPGIKSRWFITAQLVIIMNYDPITIITEWTRPDLRWEAAMQVCSDRGKLAHVPSLVGFSCVLSLHFNIPAAPLRLGFRGSAPVSVLAGLVLSPHTQTWAATSCATHVAV